MSLKLSNFIYKKFSGNIVSKGGRNRMGRITIFHRDLVAQDNVNL